jgi:hypothetical protein
LGRQRVGQWNTPIVNQTAAPLGEVSEPAGG